MTHEPTPPLPEASGTRPRAGVVVVAAGVALLVAVVIGVLLRGDGASTTTPARAERAAGQDAAARAEAVRRGVDTIAEPTYAPARPGHPDRLVVPALDVDAPVLAVRAPDRTLTPPADPQVLGWWADGARPGAATGSALVVGHTVHSGGGALDDLESLDRGDPIHVRSRVRRGGEEQSRTTSYVVASVQVFRKGTLAERAADLFSQQVDGRLVLLTCEDWDGTRFLSNVVVTALPAPAASADSRASDG